MENYTEYFEKADLVMKYLREELTPDERSELNKWLKQNESNRKLFKRLTDQAAINKELEVYSILRKDPKKEKAWQRIIDKTGYTIKRKRFISQSFMKYAAVIAIIFSAGIYFYPDQPSGTKLITNITNKQSNKNDIGPGSNKAILTLSDGSKISLDDAKVGIIAQQGGMKITKYADGKLVYEALVSGKDLNNEGSMLNTVTTPMGGQYRVVLPDKSKVWLNSASSISFPTVFKGKERNVNASGETYFEVAKNVDMPFNVNAGGVKVRVLGTHFNIMAYEGGGPIKTTLLEGSVKLIHAGSSTLLKPGEQGTISSNEQTLKVTEADLEKTVAWKNGYFRFEGASLTELMEQISRWYDVEVIYEGEMTEHEFVGQIERNKNLSQVLKVLELGDVRFRIEGKKLIVML